MFRVIGGDILRWMSAGSAPSGEEILDFHDDVESTSFSTSLLMDI